MAIEEYIRKKHFKGWCWGTFRARRTPGLSVPLYREEYRIEITQFHAEQCTPISEEEFAAFENDLDCGAVALGEFNWYGDRYQHPAQQVRIKTMGGPKGVTKEGQVSYGEFNGEFVAFVSETIQWEAPDTVELDPEPAPPPAVPMPPSPSAPKPNNRSTIGTFDSGLRVFGYALGAWSLIAVLGVLPGLLIGLFAFVLIGGVTGLLGALLGGLFRYGARAGMSLLALLQLLLLGVGVIVFLGSNTGSRVRSREALRSQHSSAPIVTERHATANGTPGDSTIIHHLTWHDNDARSHEMDWEVLRSECYSALVNIHELQLPYAGTSDWQRLYTALQEHDSIPLDRLTNAFRDLATKEKLTPARLADAVVTCVQGIPYCMISPGPCPLPGTQMRGNSPCLGPVPYGVNPPSTFIGDLVADCDSRSLLLMVVLDRLGFDATIMLSPHYHHAMLGLAAPAQGVSLTSNGRRYYFWETTATGFRLGEIHPQCADLSQWTALDL